MDESIKTRIKNQIFKFEITVDNRINDDSTFTLDYESGRYRQKELVGLIRDIVPYFALTETELKELDLSDLYKQSFTRISDARENVKGDYGELLLFVILSVFYNVPKFVTKARLRSTTKDQIKGFDCAHFSIDSNSQVTLWLGEAKFYKRISNAINSAFNSLNDHLCDPEKIKSELKLLGGNIEINKRLDKETFDLLKNYVDGGKSLDNVPIKVPVLLTYNSKCICSFCGKNININDQTFQEQLGNEINKKFKLIYSKKWPSISNISIVFFLLPFEDVAYIKKEIRKVEEAMKI